MIDNAMQNDELQVYTKNEVFWKLFAGLHDGLPQTAQHSMKPNSNFVPHV